MMSACTFFSLNSIFNVKKMLDGIATLLRMESYNVKTLCERREAKKFV